MNYQIVLLYTLFVLYKLNKQRCILKSKIMNQRKVIYHHTNHHRCKAYKPTITVKTEYQQQIVQP